MNANELLKTFLEQNKPESIEISHHAIERFRERQIQSESALRSTEAIEKHLHAMFALANPISLTDYQYNSWRLIVRGKKLVTVVRKGLKS